MWRIVNNNTIWGASTTSCLCPEHVDFMPCLTAPAVRLTLAPSLFVSHSCQLRLPLSHPPLPCFAPLVPLYWSSVKGVMKKIIVLSLGDNRLAVTHIALMLSLGFAQSVHSVFYPLNLQPWPRSLPVSNWTDVFSLVLCPAWSSIDPPFQRSLQSPSRFLSSCLSPLTSFFLSFSKYFSPRLFLFRRQIAGAGQSPTAEENNILKRSVDNAAHWAVFF